MRKFGVTTMIFVLAFVAVLGAIPVYAENSISVNAPNATVELTEAQKQELATLHQDILAKQKEVVSKYVEYGVLTKEQGDKKISRLEKRYEKLEQNGFIPKWGKCKKDKAR